MSGNHSIRQAEAAGFNYGGRMGDYLAAHLGTRALRTKSELDAACAAFSAAAATATAAKAAGQGRTAEEAAAFREAATGVWNARLVTASRLVVGAKNNNVDWSGSLFQSELDALAAI